MKHAGKVEDCPLDNVNTDLITCKVCFHGGDYEQCRLLGYKNPVRTSHETHYVSTTEHSQLILCKI
jgi:hypothetical protein